MALSLDGVLARRLEAHEAWSGVAHAETQARLYPASGATWLAVGLGRAVFCGRRSPNSRVYGWNAEGNALDEQLDAIEAFYEARSLPARVRFPAPYAREVLRRLAARRYQLLDAMDVYVRRCDSLLQDTRAAGPSSLRIGLAASAREAHLWFEKADVGGDWADPDGLGFMMIRCFHKADTQLFIAWLDGEPVGAAALEIREGIASLMAAATRPEFRRQGVHLALLHARLQAASRAGCDLAMVQARPNAPSCRNFLRLGFRLAYTAYTLRSPGAM